MCDLNISVNLGWLALKAQSIYFHACSCCYGIEHGVGAPFPLRTDGKGHHGSRNYRRGMGVEGTCQKNTYE